MRTKILLLTALAGLFAVNSSAAILVFKTSMDGPSESPPVASLGTGLATVIYDSLLHTISVEASFQDLNTPTAAAHIHCCSLPTASVAIVPPFFPGFPIGVTSGVYPATTFDLTVAANYGGGFLTAAGGTAAGAEALLVQGLLDGNAYFNIHSQTSPAGEIRGFLQLVPEPGTFVLLGGALAGVWLVRRRRRGA